MPEHRQVLLVLEESGPHVVLPQHREVRLVLAGLDGEAEHPLQHRELAIDLAGRHRPLGQIRSRPFSLPLLSRSSGSGVPSASRFVTYARSSVVVIVIIRRLPKRRHRERLKCCGTRGPRRHRVKPDPRDRAPTPCPRIVSLSEVCLVASSRYENGRSDRRAARPLRRQWSGALARQLLTNHGHVSYCHMTV